MPNHVLNHLTIKFSDTFEADRFRKATHEVERPHYDGLVDFDFHGIVPQPANMFHGNLGRVERQMCRQKGIPNWLDWNRENWGTKWGAYDVSKYEQTDNEIVVHFDTAWSPPFPILEAIVDTYDVVEIRFHYSEDDSYYGSCIWQEGEWAYWDYDNGLNWDQHTAEMRGLDLLECGHIDWDDGSCWQCEEEE